MFSTVTHFFKTWCKTLFKLMLYQIAKMLLMLAVRLIWKVRDLYNELSKTQEVQFIHFILLAILISIQSSWIGQNLEKNCLSLLSLFIVYMYYLWKKETRGFIKYFRFIWISFFFICKIWKSNIWLSHGALKTPVLFKLLLKSAKKSWFMYQNLYLYCGIIL